MLQAAVDSAAAAFRIREKGTKRRLPVLIALASICFCCEQTTANELPDTYIEFRSIGANESLAAAIVANRYLYLPPGNYVIENPIIIDRDEPLFLHGAGRRGTRLLARDSRRPLLLVKRAPVVNLSNLDLAMAEKSPKVGVRALITTNEEPVRVEMHDCSVDDAAIEIRGPGEIRLQNVIFFPRGGVRAPIVIDHPDALFTMVGGNISNIMRKARFTSDEAYHVWQKRGRLRVYGTGVEATLGRADFRIESASRHGPHVLAHVRSEGANGANRGAHRAMLIEVPKTSEAVDLVVESSSANWARLGMGEGTFIDYNAAGTVWLLGNNAALGARALVAGDAPKARILALGNASYAESDPLPVTGAQKVSIGNIYYRDDWKGLLVARVALEPTRGSPEMLKQALAALPRIEFPEPLRRPRLEARLPGMLSVRDYRAVGDGQHDDTKSIQAALDANCGRVPGKVLFFPPGTYRVSKRLLFNHRDAKCTQHAAGGWIAGAGSDRTRIVRASGTPGGVFTSQGLAYVTFQGLAFEATPFDAKAPAPVTEAAFSVENEPDVGRASSGVSFYDVVFSGGRQALGIGLETRTNCEHTIAVDSEFRNAHVGLAVGSHNALNNLVYRGTFTDNDVAMAQDEATLRGGTWAVLGARIRGTRLYDIGLRNSASGAWYFNGLDSDTPVLMDRGVTGSIFPLLFEQSRWSPRNDSPLRFSSRAAGGPIFFRSSTGRLALSLRSPGASYALALDSTIEGLDEAVIGAQSYVWSSGP